MGNTIARRTLVTRGLMAGTAISALGLIGSRPSGAADIPALDPKDPTAVTLTLGVLIGRTQRTVSSWMPFLRRLRTFSVDLGARSRQMAESQSQRRVHGRNPSERRGKYLLAPPRINYVDSRAPLRLT